MNYLQHPPWERPPHQPRVWIIIVPPGAGDPQVSAPRPSTRHLVNALTEAYSQSEIFVRALTRAVNYPTHTEYHVRAIPIERHNPEFYQLGIDAQATGEIQDNAPRAQYQIAVAQRMATQIPDAYGVFVGGVAYGPVGPLAAPVESLIATSHDGFQSPYSETTSPAVAQQKDLIDQNVPFIFETGIRFRRYGGYVVDQHLVRLSPYAHTPSYRALAYTISNRSRNLGEFYREDPHLTSTVGRVQDTYRMGRTPVANDDTRTIVRRDRESETAESRTILTDARSDAEAFQHTTRQLRTRAEAHERKLADCPTPYIGADDADELRRCIGMVPRTADPDTEQKLNDRLGRRAPPSRDIFETVQGLEHGDRFGETVPTPVDGWYTYDRPPLRDYPVSAGPRTLTTFAVDALTGHGSIVEEVTREYGGPVICTRSAAGVGTHAVVAMNEETLNPAALATIAATGYRMDPPHGLTVVTDSESTARQARDACATPWRRRTNGGVALFSAPYHYLRTDDQLLMTRTRGHWECTTDGELRYETAGESVLVFHPPDPRPKRGQVFKCRYGDGEYKIFRDKKTSVVRYNQPVSIAQEIRPIPVPVQPARLCPLATTQIFYRDGDDLRQCPRTRWSDASDPSISAAKDFIRAYTVEAQGTSLSKGEYLPAFRAFVRGHSLHSLPAGSDLTTKLQRANSELTSGSTVGPSNSGGALDNRRPIIPTDRAPLMETDVRRDEDDPLTRLARLADPRRYR